MSVLVAGDFCDKNRVSKLIYNECYDRMFDNVKNIVSDADISIVNFEFPIVEDKGLPIKKCGPNLKGHPNSVEAIKYAGFDVCTLANNHILDQGAKCCLDTKSLLEKSGIKTVGVGENLEDTSGILYLPKNGERIAIINCAENEFSIATESTPGAYPINPIRQYHQIVEARQNADYVIVITHGGHEHFNLPSPRMKEIYRFFIEVGADTVVNHHQHCYSGYEEYQGKPIFYGLGNFLFDNPNYRNTFWNEGYMVELDLHDGCVEYKVIPYTQCNDEPTIQLLETEESKVFHQKIAELNSTIADDSKLRAKIYEYYSKSASYELSIIEPYRGRILNKLYSMHLLPTFVKNSKLAAILNHVCCESHRDKLLYALTQKNK